VPAWRLAALRDVNEARRAGEHGVAHEPTVWSAPWTAVIFWKRAKGEIYEYACHEGNYSLRGMLAGAGADEGASR
jgi:hypothetical protein